MKKENKRLAKFVSVCMVISILVSLFISSSVIPSIVASATDDTATLSFENPNLYSFDADVTTCAFTSGGTAFQMNLGENNTLFNTEDVDISLSEDRAYGGDYSFKVMANSALNNQKMNFKLVPAGAAMDISKAVVKYYIPGDAAVTGDFISYLYVADWFTRADQYDNPVTKNSWQTVTLDFGTDSGGNISELGFEFYLTIAAGKTALYVDSIEFYDEAGDLIPTLDQADPAVDPAATLGFEDSDAYVFSKATADGEMNNGSGAEIGFKVLDGDNEIYNKTDIGLSVTDENPYNENGSSFKMTANSAINNKVLLQFRGGLEGLTVSKIVAKYYIPEGVLVTGDFQGYAFVNGWVGEYDPVDSITPGVWGALTMDFGLAGADSLLEFGFEFPWLTADAGSPLLYIDNIEIYDENGDLIPTLDGTHAAKPDFQTVKEALLNKTGSYTIIDLLNILANG